jgi:hypothetical protein
MTFSVASLSYSSWLNILKLANANATNQKIPRLEIQITTKAHSSDPSSKNVSENHTGVPGS